MNINVSEQQKAQIIEILEEGSISEYFEPLMTILGDPMFENNTKVHDWRNYVPCWYIDRWDELGIMIRVAVFVMAELRASAEEWD